MTILHLKTVELQKKLTFSNNFYNNQRNYLIFWMSMNKIFERNYFYIFIRYLKCFCE